MIQLNDCLANPECYEDKGIIKISEELEKTKQILDAKIERYLELEEKKERFEND